MVKHMDSKKLLKYFFIISAFQSIAANFAHPATPTLIQNLGLNDYMFGVAFAGMSLTNFLFSPFWGQISDQIGRRKVLGLSGLGYAVGKLDKYVCRALRHRARIFCPVCGNIYSFLGNNNACVNSYGTGNS